MAVIVSGALPTQKLDRTFRRTEYKIRAYQIVLSVSLVRPGDAANSHIFPALLDTGNSGDFTIGEDLLRSWANLNLSQLQPYGTIHLTGTSGNRYKLPRYSADLIVHSNETRKGLARIELRGGIAVFPKALKVPGPPIPTIGVRALHAGGARVSIDYRALGYEVSLDLA